jgi:hypothetical protein
VSQRRSILGHKVYVAASGSKISTAFLALCKRWGL